MRGLKCWVWCAKLEVRDNFLYCYRLVLGVKMQFPGWNSFSVAAHHMGHLASTFRSHAEQVEARDDWTFAGGAKYLVVGRPDGGIELVDGVVDTVN